MFILIAILNIKTLDLIIVSKAELAYWKQRMAHFNNLLEQIKSQRLKAVIGVLQAAKSKSLEKWKEMVIKLT